MFNAKLFPQTTQVSVGLDKVNFFLKNCNITNLYKEIAKNSNTEMEIIEFSNGL